MKFLLVLSGASLFATSWLSAQPIHSLLPAEGRFKVSGGLLVQWDVKANEHDRDAIEAFDRNGTRVLGINVYRLMPAATDMVIDDVAVLPGESIAIAAVTREGNRPPRAWLLRLGGDTRLVNTTELDAAKAVGWIAFDEAGNIWGLTDYGGEKVGKDVPLILVFNAQGRVVKSLLRQADFPDGLRERPDRGEVSFGVTGDQVWFWQPSRHRMTITDRDGDRLRKVSVPPRAHANAGPTILTPDGDVVQDVLSPAYGVAGVYVVKAGRIERFIRPANTSFAGMDESEFVFLSQKGSATDFEIRRMKSLAELQNIRTLIRR